LDLEAICIWKKLLLAVLILFSIGIICSSNLYATNETQTADAANLTLEQTSIETSNYTTNTSITLPPRETSAAGDSSNNQTGNNSTNSTEMSAAGDPSNSHIRGVWLRADCALRLNVTDVTNLQNANITDVFVNVFGMTNPEYQSVLNSTIRELNDTRIRIHAWINCFMRPCNWIDPQGRYSRQVWVQRREPYTVRVRRWVRVQRRFRVRGRWRSRWVRVRRWVHETRHRTRIVQETRNGYNMAQVNQVFDFISRVTTEYSGSIHGIHLDYVRFRGRAGHRAYERQTHGATTITDFVQRVYNRVNSINPDIQVSAALMAEHPNANTKYYGQNYTQLSQFLDFMVPMIYKPYYNQNTAWIENTTRNLTRHSNGAQVVAGILTYRSRENTTPIPAEELNEDIDAAIRGGSSGFVLFRYGLIDNAFFENSNGASGDYPLTNSPYLQQHLQETRNCQYLQRYLQETRNCEVNNPAIRSLAASITSGASSTYDMAERIFNWVKDNISYAFYRNTLRGAVGTLNNGTGNCVDQSHLLIALSRAAGLPAKYMHGTCTFIPSGNIFGHVWARIWVNGRWHDADTTSSRNTFGVIRNWNTETVVMRGMHISLPF